MNPEALESAYKLFVDTGYNGTSDDFSSLINSNQEALNASFNQFVETGYNGSEEDFKNLVGVGKVENTTKAKEPEVAPIKEKIISEVETFDWEPSLSAEEYEALPLMNKERANWEKFKEIELNKQKEEVVKSDVTADTGAFSSLEDIPKYEGLTQSISLAPNKDGLYSVFIEDGTTTISTPSFPGEPSFTSGDKTIDKRKANKEDMEVLLPVMDALQKEAFKNLQDYGFGNENALGSDTYTISTEQHAIIKDSIYDKFVEKAGIPITRDSFNFLYNETIVDNKDQVERDYKSNRIRPESTEVSPEFKEMFVLEADKGKSEVELTSDSLKAKQFEITKELNNINNVLIPQAINRPVDKDESSTKRNRQLSDLNKRKIKLENDYKDLDKAIEQNATSTKVIGGWMPGDPLSFQGKPRTYKEINEELNSKFFNMQGRSKESTKKLNKVSQDVENTAGVRAQNLINENPALSQREAVEQLFNDELLYLQQFEADGRNSFVDLKFTPEQLSGGNPMGAKVLRALDANGLKKNIDDSGNINISLYDLRAAGIDSRNFEGYFDELGNLISDKDLTAVKMYNEEVDEVTVAARTFRNLAINNVDVGAIEKPDGFVNLLQTGAVATLETLGMDKGEAEEFLTGTTEGTARTQIDNLDRAIKTANNTPEIQASMGGKIELTEDQKENISTSMTEEVTSGIGGFVPDLMILGATGGVMNAMGYAKLISKMSPMARFITGAAVEEAKMQTILGMKPGGGATFYTLGAATSGIGFKKKFKWLDPLFQKVIKAGPIGAISAEGAGVAELAYESFMGDKNFKDEFDEMYKDFSTVSRRAIVNSMVFGLTGFTHVKRSDFMTTQRKYEVVSELKNEVNNLMGQKLDFVDGPSSELKLDKDGVVIPNALKPKKQFKDLSPKDQKKFAEYTQRIQTLNQQIQAETMYHKLDPNSKNFEQDFDKMITEPMNRAMKTLVPNFEGVKVKFGRRSDPKTPMFKKNFDSARNTAQYNPKTKEMFFDLDAYTAGKPPHEFTHVALGAYLEANPGMKLNFTKNLGKVFEGFNFGEYEGTELAKRIKERYNIDLRTWKGKNLAAEEYLAFMGEFLADPKVYYTNPNLASTFMNEVRLEVKDFLVEAGLKTPNVKTAKDVVQLLGRIGSETRMGGRFEVKMQTLAKLDEIDVIGAELVKANRKADKAVIEKETRSSLDLEGAVVKKTTKEIVEDNRKLRAEILKNPDGKPNRKQRDQIVDNNKNLIYSILNKYETITGFKLSKNIKEEAAFELQLKLYEYAERYDANKNDVGAYLNMGFTKQVVNTLKKVGSFDKEVSESDLGDGESSGLENLVDQTFSTSGVVSSIPEEFIDSSTGKLDATKVLKDPEVTVKLLDKRIQDSNLIIESYKTTPDLSNVSKDFGVKDGKVNNEDGTFKGKTSTRLSAPEVSSSQKYILENAEMLYELLPDGKTTKTAKESLKETSTGVQPVLLNAFYEIGDRVSTAAGLKGQEKLPFNRSKFLDYFGIKEDGAVFETIKENGKIDQRIKALIHQDGKAVTNAQIRKIKELTANEIEDLKSGKSESLASMSLNDVDFLGEVVEKLNSGEKLTPKYIKALATERNASDFITKLSLTTTDKQKKAVVSHLQEFVVDPKIKIEREKQARREDMTLEEIGKEEELNISRWNKALPGLRKLSGFKDLQPITPGTRSKNVTSAENRDRTIKSFNKILKKFPALLENDNFSKYVRNTFGEGSLKTFGLKKYKGKKGDAEYFGIAEFKDVFGKVESKGERLDFMYDVFMVNFSETGFKKKWEKEIEAAKVKFPLWESSQGEQYKSYLTSFGRDALSNPKLVDANGKLLPNAYERTMDANREAIKYTYEKLSEVYKESPTKETLEDIITFLQIQTGQATGIIKGLAPMEYLSLVGEATRPGGKRFHNEHNKDLFIYNTEFVNLLLKSKNGIGSEKFIKELENITNSVSQSLTSDTDRAIKDDPKYGGTGGSIDPIVNDVLLTSTLNPGQGSRTLSLRDFNKSDKVTTVADLLLKEYGKKEAENILTKFPPSKAKVEIEQQVKYPRTKVVKNNVEVLKEASMASKDLTQSEMLNELNKRDKAFRLANERNKTIKKARVFDFDDTVARTNSKVFAERDGKRKVLTAEEFAKQGKDLVDAGWKMDFSDFNRVVEGKKGPLFELMKKMKESAGDRDMFILTARAPESAPAIKEFLDAMGIEIPLENITGLGNSTGEAKAGWLVDKAAEGYNDFYFADDAPQNVKAVQEGMSRLDVKSKTQLVKASKDLKIDSERDKKKLNWKTDEAGNIKTTFEVAGKKYNFNLDARDNKGSFDVEFNLGGRIDITGTGNAVKVIRTVYNGLLDVVSKNPKIKRLEFSSLKSEQSRVKLYTTLMDRVAKKLGWETDIWESNDFITPEKSSYDFEITKPRKKQVAPVEKALEVIDIKSNTQKNLASKDLSKDFNNLIEESTGIGAEKVFSDVKAQVRGAKAKRQRFFIPPSAEDMLGLVYTTLGKGKKGEAHLKFYQENLFDPYTKAMENLSTDRVNLMSDFKALKKELDVPKDLAKKTESGFTNEQAVRVHLWNKMGEKIPGLSKTDLKELNDIVENNPKLEAFADQILSITKGDGYSTPKENWAVGTITTDLIDVLNTKKRGKYLETWKQNKDIIYSKENLNKLEAAYGPKYRAAIENSLRRMESGSNRLGGGNQLSNKVLDYINNSTGAIMFFNTRSAILQTISAANFINWGFNNPLRAGKAFANQPQYWKDFVELMNSDYLKDRRNGLKLNINESEIANAAKTSGNKAKAALNYILEKGYAPTKYADSFAIASGGATFYRNRINDLVKNEGKTEAEAKEIAMKEFRQVSEISQQSSDPSKISQQQSSDLGRIVLQFANTPMQYARIQKRAVQDIVNGRGDLKTNISKIAYYGFLQNMIFNGLQQGLFALGFGDDEIDEKEEGKLIKAANGMLDSSLRGLGMAGVTVQVLKNLGIDIYDRSKRDRPEYSDSYKKLLDFSPAVKSKLGKFQSAAYPFDSKKRRAEVFEKGFSLDNPAYESMAKVVTGTTNLPLDRMYSKVNNLSAAMDQETETWQSIAMVLGWPEWQIKGKQNYVESPEVKKKKSLEDTFL